MPLKRLQPLQLRQQQMKWQEGKPLRKSRGKLTVEVEMAAIDIMNMKTESRTLIILMLPQEITMQDAKWKDVSERQKRTDTTTIVMLRLINVTSMIVQEGMNRNSVQKPQCVKKPAARWTDASRKLTDTVMLRRVEKKLIQNVTAKPEIELITAITQTGIDRLTAAQE